jgi:hypothetical protein
MTYSTTIAELHRAGITLKPNEAVAIAQKLISNRHHGPPQPPFGPPSMETVIIDEQGTVTCPTCAVTPAVSEIAILLDGMLPTATRLPGALRYTIARALLNVDAPPFDSIDELSSALSRFERNERDAVVRELIERARATNGGTVSAAVIPFKSSPAVRFKPERRHALSAAVTAELRRDLRRADLERYARQAATTLPDLRGALHHHGRPMGVVMAGLGAGFVLIASGEFMALGGGSAPEPLTQVSIVTAPMPRLPEPATAFLPSSDVIDDEVRAAAAPTGASTRALVAERESRRARVDGGEQGRKPRGRQAPRASRVNRRSPPTGVLARFRLQWVRNLFTFKHDL